MSHFVIDNLLPDNQFFALHDAIMNKRFPWFYSGIVGAHNSAGEDFYFVHYFFDQGGVCSDLMPLLTPLLEKINAQKLLRAKVNLYPNVGKLLHNESHIDMDFPHRGAVFYINTNNGFTVLEGNTHIPSIANRLLLFDSSRPHNSTHCTDEKRRVTLNLNFL